MAFETTPQYKSKYRNILIRDFRTLKNGEVVNYNIGTAAHAPANIALLKKFLPETDIAVWSSAPLEKTLAAMMRKRFPEVAILQGSFDPETGMASPPEFKAQIDKSDLFLVSSGSGITADVARDLKLFSRFTGKPFGVYAVGYVPEYLDILNESACVSFRDTTALRRARKDGLRFPEPLFAPDAVFYFDCLDEAGADNFLKANNLAANEYVCCIPGARHTPRWDYFGTPVIAERLAENKAMEERDHEPLLHAICTIVRQTGLKVLICAEQIPEMELAERLIYNKLPEDVRRNCVLLREYWSPDLALSVYKRSRCVFGIEMHSQVMALGNGVPAVVCRHRGFGSKSDMWRDVGAENWLLDIDGPDYHARLIRVLLEILADRSLAEQQVKRIRERIDMQTRTAIRSSFAK